MLVTGARGSTAPRKRRREEDPARLEDDEAMRERHDRQDDDDLQDRLDRRRTEENARLGCATNAARWLVPDG